jgi:hypothetical protein
MSEALHPAPVEFTPGEIYHNPLLRFFHYAHLPEPLRAVSAQFARMARHVMDTLPSSAERTMALRKLLEAKDCAVRPALP